MSIERYVDSYGFESLDVHAQNGGHKKITFHGGFSDIAHITSSNGVGLGSSDYIRDMKDVQRHISSTEQTVWLSDEEKGAIISFLMEIWKLTEGFLKVRERFNIAKSYKEGKGVYTFTEKPEAVITLHSEITITVAIPSSWTESNAWRALQDVLNPKSISSEERFALKKG